MDRFITIIKYDYLQRTRSYHFIITVCFSLAFAYSFIPSPDAKYSTVRIGDYLGNYNSAWIAYVSAIMTSVFLSLIGYYLINNSLKNDAETRVGQIIATTRISNFMYLFSKALSNFFVLLTILLIILVMSILLFFLYGDGFSFMLSDFIIAYLLIPLPAIFFISTLSVVLEVFLGRKSVVQNTVFFFLFMFIMGINLNKGEFLSVDLFGTNAVTEAMVKQVGELNPASDTNKLNIGFTVGGSIANKRFNFNGVDLPISYILFRLLWIILGVGLIVAISPFFHRFNLKEKLRVEKSKSIVTESENIKEIELSLLPKTELALGIFPFYKTELLMMIRKGPKWLWILNLVGVLLLTFIPITYAHTIVLPILWFLQVSRWADMTTKERENNMSYFALSSFKPVSRLLTAQLLAGVSLAIMLALPLMVRYVLQFNVISLASVFLGGVFIVMLSAFFGIISQGRKLFEILFFLIAYTNINRVPFTDYFGGIAHSQHYLMIMGGLTSVLIGMSYGIRKYELSQM